MNVLNRKLLRDLAQLKGQVLTIALVVACGIAAYASMGSTYTSLEASRDAYYDGQRFADVFVQLKRAPNGLVRRLEAIEQLAVVQTRVVEPVTLPLPHVREPIRGQVVSLPDHGAPRLNDVYLQQGRLPEPGRQDEALVMGSFAEAHGLGPGDRLPVVMGGVLRHVRIVGLAMSPEFVYPIAPGELFPDPERFTALWMRRQAVAPALAMEGAFNDVVARLAPGASEATALARLDTLLAPYGGLGAYGRERQVSHQMVSGELEQLRAMATVAPLIFLGVAALLVNVVLSRLVQLQRGEVAVLKAVGYRDLQVSAYYFKLIGLISALGAVLGVGVGGWLGQALTNLYTAYFHFPVLTFRMDPTITVSAIVISVLAAGIGGLGTLRRLIRLPPAEAMQAPAPARYRRGWVDRLGLTRLLSQSATMVLREVQRRPARTLLSALGIAMAVAVMVVGRFMYDAIDSLLYLQFERAQREDMTVTFTQAVDAEALGALRMIPGVLDVEPERSVPVRFRHRGRWRDGLISGHAEPERLRQIVDVHGDVHLVPAEGLMLTHMLAEVLGVQEGDRVDVEIREGERRTEPVRVVRLVEELMGLQGHMQLGALNRLMRESPVITGARLRVDPARLDATYRHFRDMPRVLSVVRRRDQITRYESESAEQILVFTSILVFFAGVIAVGVVYNNARVALSMRRHELASLRVLGFTRGEISAILLGELAVQVGLALLPGLLIGVQLVDAMMSTVDPEQFRLPVVVSARTHAFAIGFTLIAAAASGLLVRRRLDRLDLIGVLKVRE